MKFWTRMAFALLGFALLASARPKDSDAISVSTDKITATEPNTIQILDIQIDRITNLETGKVTEFNHEAKKTETGNSGGDHWNLLPANVNRKCPSVICSKPPLDAVCETADDPDLNVMGPIMGAMSDCCPLYMCNRADGSFFMHFGMSTTNPKGLTQSAVSTSASTSTSSTSGSRFGFGGLSSFSSQSGQAYSPSSNSFVSSANFGLSGNYGNGNLNFMAIPSFGLPNLKQTPGAGDGSNFARHESNRYESSNGFQNPSLPVFPVMPVMTFQAPLFPNPMFPTAWNLRGRRGATSFSGQGVGQPSQPLRPQGYQNYFHGMGQQQPQAPLI